MQGTGVGYQALIAMHTTLKVIEALSSPLEEVRHFQDTKRTTKKHSKRVKKNYCEIQKTNQEDPIKI